MANNLEIERIILSISKIIKEPVDKININSKALDFSRWDSLAHIRIILEIEKITKKNSFQQSRRIKFNKSNIKLSL